jgi:hypothetical protein
MKYLLEDDSVAHLVSITQNRNYLPGYRELPPDGIIEIIRLAGMNIPKDSWRPAPMLFIGMTPEVATDLLRSKKLPEVLCVGLFYSIRGGTGQKGKASYLYVVWLQEEFLPHISAANQAAFARIKWPDGN